MLKKGTKDLVFVLHNCCSVLVVVWTLGNWRVYTMVSEGHAIAICDLLTRKAGGESWILLTMAKSCKMGLSSFNMAASLSDGSSSLNSNHKLRGQKTGRLKDVKGRGVFFSLCFCWTPVPSFCGAKAAFPIFLFLLKYLQSRSNFQVSIHSCHFLAAWRRGRRESNKLIKKQMFWTSRNVHSELEGTSRVI